jgi:hypothetical protein
VRLAEGAADEAARLLERASAAQPNEPAILLNLSDCHRAAGDTRREIETLDRALALDPFLVPALVRKAQAYERADDLAGAAKVYRALLANCPDAARLPPPIRAALDHGRKLVERESEERAQIVAAPVAEVVRDNEDEDLRRAQAYVENLCGRRKVFVQQPTGAHFPFLPAYEFFDRTLFPWFETLEAATEEMRAEILGLWREDAGGFEPYVAFEQGAPVNQWSELNHSPRWSAFFFWKDGLPCEENRERCPATARLLDSLPLLDIPGRAPTAMFSILKPRTRIPPHTGTTNIRTTVHLPLVVPEGCGFRVGGETRTWREGEAWAFDDTVEHEAWNDSDRPRAILILDCWNPLLTPAERAIVGAANRALADAGAAAKRTGANAGL